jgi:radical SAM protein with 4Fe4S-binding SPASM domain
MEIGTAKKIILSMARNGAEECVIIGGEPSLYTPLKNVIEYAKSLDLKVFIVSNGRFPGDILDIDSLIGSGPDAVNISLHGWDQTSYETYTGSKKGFAEVCSTITELKRKGVNLGTSFVLSDLVKNKLKTIIGNFADIGVEFIEFNIAAPAVSEKGVDGSFVIPLEEQAGVVMEAYELCVEGGINPGFNLTIPQCLFSSAELNELFENSKITYGCSLRNGSGIVFKPDGAITVCNHFNDFEAASGSEVLKVIDNDEIDKFCNSDDLNNIRSEVVCYHHEACEKCNRWSECGGGCPINWIYFDPGQIDLTPFS